MENWKVCEGDYEISDLGNLRRNNSAIKPRLDKYGYLIVTLWMNGVACTRKIHRLVANAFIENLENKPQVNHIGKDDNGMITKLDNRAISLEWSTCLENLTHAMSNGCFKIGSEKATTILDEEKVALIKDLIVEGYGNSEIGHLFGVTCGAIYSIRMNEGWQHVKWPVPYRHFEPTRVVKIVGSQHKSAKLDEDKVRQIKIKLKANESISDLMQEFNISGGALRCIRAGTTWKHVVID
jgi:hypothetical protein